MLDYVIIMNKCSKKAKGVLFFLKKLFLAV